MRNFVQYLNIALLLFLLPVSLRADTSTVVAIQDGYVQSANATYATARDATTGTSIADHIRVGQIPFEGTYYDFRAYLAFPIEDIAGTYTAAVLSIKGLQDASTQDFDVHMVAAQYGPTLYADDFASFTGHTASTAYTLTDLAETWNSESIVAWNSITLNAAGLSLLNAAQGDTLWIALISANDAAKTAPTDSEYVRFYNSSTADSEPYLTLTSSNAIQHKRHIIWSF